MHHISIRKNLFSEMNLNRRISYSFVSQLFFLNGKFNATMVEIKVSRFGDILLYSSV